MVYLKDLQEQLRSFLRHPAVGLSLAVSFTGNAMLWGIIGSRIGSWPAVIPLHYTIYFGIDLFGSWQQLFALPALGLVVMATNSLLAFRLFNRERIASYCLIIGSALVQLVLLRASVTILNIQ